MARIFVIDDDEQLLRMIGLMLERGGHNITLIDNPFEGFEQLKIEKPDLLVLDVMMPSLSGHDLTRQIRETNGLEDLPILILTARSQEIDRDTAFKSGADGYLSKPVTSQEIIEEIDSLLTKKAKPDDSTQGMVLSFFGLRGGVGRTTIATNLAVALRRLSKEEVCLVDLSTSVGQSAYHLHLQPNSSWSDLIELDSIDWSSLKENLLIHPSGLRLLAAPSIPQDPMALSANFTKSLIQLLQTKMVFTILDLPPVLSPSFMTALEMADIGLHVLSPEVIAIRTAVKVNNSLIKANIKPKRRSYVLNQVSDKNQIPKSAVERAVNGRIPFHIEFDPNQSNALTQGAPLILSSTDSPMSTVVKRMAEVIWKRLITKKETGTLA